MSRDVCAYCKAAHIDANVNIFKVGEYSVPFTRLHNASSAKYKMALMVLSLFGVTVETYPDRGAR